MGFGSIGQWLVVLVVVLILFGTGRLATTMADLAKSIRAFRFGGRDEDLAGPGTVAANKPAPRPRIARPPATPQD